MKKDEFIKVFETINIKDEMQHRILENCIQKKSKTHYFFRARRYIPLATTFILLICISITVYAITSGLSLKLPNNEMPKNTDYILTLQKELITLEPDVMEELLSHYFDFKKDYSTTKSFTSFKDASEFFKIPLLDNSLLKFQNDNYPISLEVYGTNNTPSRVKLVSYQTITDDLPSYLVMIAEFALAPEGNYSQIIASSSDHKKFTQTDTYHSPINDITSQIALIVNKKANYNTVEIYFMYENVLYHISYDSPSSNLKEAMPLIKRIVDGFII